MSSHQSDNHSYQYIDQPDMLDHFCRSIKGTPWIALDTEFIREKSYYPQLCLIQIGVSGQAACIDPLGIDDLAPLYDLLYDRSVVKVLHACSQDLEIFVHLQGKVPGPIFDTQLAAPLLGLPEQMGYANFVKDRLDLSLDKTQTRTDWSHRPLSDKQLKYAGDDVRYLADIYPTFCEQLDDLGRLDWLQAEFSPYEQLERYRHDPAQAWQRIRGVEKLRPAALSIVQLLARWREQLAQQRDLPRNWIFKDDALVDIARMAPQQTDELIKIRALPPKSVARHGQQIINLVQEANQRQPDPLPGWKQRTKPSGQEEALADILHAQLRLLADRHKINSTVLASRKDLVALVQGDGDIPVLHGWRLEMAGNELLAMYNGKRIVSVNNGNVEVSEPHGVLQGSSD
ncbi:MAG: ribonuclease D [Gammaproteobacteria bacterium]|nr:MAG: ribonuclease D [Gammaproteobacteria bacterium]